MYNKFFGFKEKPFRLVPNPEYLFLSKSHEEVLAHLAYAISQGDGFVEITGEVGTGKTTLCRVFLENLDKSVNAAYIFNPKLDAFQLLKAINDEFGIDSSPDNTTDLIDRLNAFLIEKKAAGQKVLVLIDEAQNLSLEVLEQLRLLSNLETTQEKLLQIILVGQPELGDLLSSHQLRQLGQRITINCQLSPLTYEETRDYIRHRISLASHRAGPPFDKASYRAIYEFSQGVPRLINIACDRALLNAFSRNSFKITPSITKEAIRELARKKPVHSYNWLQGLSGLVIVSAIFAALVIVLLYFANGEPPQPPAVSKQSPPEGALQFETGQARPAEKQVSMASAPPENPAAPQSEAVSVIKADDPAQVPQEGTEKSVMPPADPESITLLPEKHKIPLGVLPGPESESREKNNGENTLHSVHVGTFPSASLASGRVDEMKALGYPSFMYTQENASRETVFVVVAGTYQSYDLAKEAGRTLSRAGYNNFVSRAKDSLAPGKTATGPQARAPIAVKQPQNSSETQSFLNYLKDLNSRFSRNNSMEEILGLWLPTAEIHIKQSRIDTDRFFFQEASKEYGLEVQPIATESDLAFIENLNLPAIFTFYLTGHSWPKYLAVAHIDKEKMHFITGGQGQTTSVDKSVFLQYWSGEAYIFWKNFKNLPGMITRRSKGQDVKTLKQLLQQLGYSGVAMTDSYDDGTVQLIKTIQKKYGFHIDGLVGPLTKIALYNESSEFAKPSLGKFETAKTEDGN